MADALIGYSGFVGSNILEQRQFANCYNSKNIEKIHNTKLDTVICAGVSAVKWKANKFPKEDYKNICKLIKHIDKAIFNKLILISTISVYDNPIENPYGRNRLFLEKSLMNKYPSLTIIRLPSLFGKGLKKNAIFDLINKNYGFLPSPESKTQYYCLDNLWKDIEIAINNKLPILNITSEPIIFSDIINLFPPLYLDLSPNYSYLYESIHPSSHEKLMISKYSHLWGKSGCYLYSKEEVFFELKNFINQQLTC